MTEEEARAMLDGSSTPVPANLFIVGAPKAGSTTLTHLLELHPEIFFAEGKDTQYLARDLVAPEAVFGEEGYREMFSGWDGEPRVGEASVYYLYSETALEEISSRSRDPRIVILVRNPIDLVHSYHGQLVFNGQQPVEDFEEAVEIGTRGRAAGKRADGDAILDACLLDYEHVGTLSPHIERWIAKLGEERVALVLLDDLASDAEGVLRRLFRWMGVDPGVELDLDAVLESKDATNPHAVPRSETLREAVHRPDPWLRRIVRMLLPSTRLRGLVAGFLDRHNRTFVEREEMSPEVRARLERRFEPEIRRLEEILGRDLGHWLA